jgi:hypothetical protein
MTDRSLPAGLRDAKKQHEDTIWSGNSAVEAVHVIRFVFRHEDGVQQDVAEFITTSPLHVPSEGQTITLHDVPVTVIRVEPDYGASADGLPCVTAEVIVVPFEET